MVRKSLASARVVILNLGTRRYPLVDVIREHGLNVEDTGGRLHGVAGLGRVEELSEKFYRVKGEA
jgi:hypothetical protein